MQQAAYRDDCARTYAAAPNLKRLRWLAYLLDNLIRLPGGRRIGLDGIIGLIPGIGDAAGAIFAAYIVAEAARLGTPTTTLARMIYNLGLDALVGAVPLLGDLFDFVWKANSKNITLPGFTTSSAHTWPQPARWRFFEKPSQVAESLLVLEHSFGRQNGHLGR